MGRFAIVVEVTSCGDCPFLNYDAYYDCSTDSGYDCYFVGRRANDREIEKWEAEKQEGDHPLKRRPKNCPLIPISKIDELKETDNAQMESNCAQIRKTSEKSSGQET